MIKKSSNFFHLKRISSDKKHSAFTDLVKINDKLVCCYRQATNHVSGDGRIEITVTDLNSEVVSRQHLSFPRCDLRDPKLSIDEGGRIFLLAYARMDATEKSCSRTRWVSWFSDNGLTWSSPHFFGTNGWWLWRIRWQQGQAYGFAYNRQHNRVDLYSGHPQKTMYLHKSYALSLRDHKLGYPNESDLIFDRQGTMWALIRRDADSFTAQLGRAKPPYTRWEWHDLQTYIGGPVMHGLTENSVLVAGRIWQNNQPRTALWHLQLNTAKLTHLLTVPSAADNSYPGIVLEEDTCYLSYYSGHIDNQTRVYLATIRNFDKWLNKIE
ncbi:hypothetical protein [Alteromonas sp. ASW11-130]|uniref:hypothetical protein n=1 Tax=Alteromonas sp. ASW11-130 TaxID=3015775 RepID=UPI0022428A7B|nr:hypothetical protein [Alteromonas sp. ASW11-130]MCW8091805.1 hypothetical protein [Alteromonas sp. ASW11-130]